MLALLGPFGFVGCEDVLRELAPANVFDENLLFLVSCGAAILFEGANEFDRGDVAMDLGLGTAGADLIVFGDLVILAPPGFALSIGLLRGFYCGGTRITSCITTSLTRTGIASSSLTRS